MLHVPVVPCFEEEGSKLFNKLVVSGILCASIRSSERALEWSGSDVQNVRGSSVNCRPQWDLSNEPSADCGVSDNLVILGQTVGPRFVFQSNFPLASTNGSRSPGRK
jgi:hypothetical protein